MVLPAGARLRFADPAEGERSERDSELAGRQVGVEVLEQTHQALCGALPEARAFRCARAHADERKLRGHKKAVGCDQQQHGDEFYDGSGVDGALAFGEQETEPEFVHSSVGVGIIARMEIIQPEISCWQRTDRSLLIASSAVCVRKFVASTV